jgi:integrase
MPYIRRLPSGLWQATVRHPSGKRLTKTDPLRRVVDRWAKDLEAQYARGDLRDPRAGHITVAEFGDRWIRAHVVAATTRQKIECRWRVHCLPKWGSWPMDSITRMEAQGWVRDLEVTPRAKWGGRRILDEDDAPYLAPGTIAGIVGVMTGLYRAAVADSIVVTNPFANLALPTIPPARVVYYSREEHARLLAAMDRLGLDYRWRVMTDLAAHVGLRYGEMAGLAGDRVNWLRGEIEVSRVWTVHGLREYPKSRRSHRTVPVPEWVMDGMARLMRGRDRTEMVFAGPGSKHPWHSEWHRAWYAAVDAAGVPSYSPHALRHTAASWLVMDGVDLYRVQALLGHESYRTTERYAHLAPSAHDAVRAVWRDARVTHGG